MQNRLKAYATIVTAAATMSLAACGGGSKSDYNGTNTSAGDVAPPAASTVTPSTAAPATEASVDTTAPDHHSKLKGALVGAAAGHFLGHHALAGAAAGALIQHERNKHP
ncbi:MAG TPA: hypothetical protein VH277_12180 [Gemmatimonadaceae bacterium]|jgi:hypothetical protein|nr:hypothetical protein [Gemmatimonadaceae bacterium]